MSRTDMGVDDPRKTVGAVWFDYNEDGRLDVFVANQDGTLNGLYRNRRKRFWMWRTSSEWTPSGGAATSGSNGPSVADYNHDGNMDLFVASYGPNFLFHNDGGGKFTEVAEGNAAWEAAITRRRRTGAITITMGGWICTCPLTLRSP